MRILLTNDDGYSAPGLQAVQQALRDVGDVIVVAPDREKSAASHAITLDNPLRINRQNECVIAVDGTPTDCVLLAHHKLLEQRADMLVSGINHGPNMGDDVSYSGTVAAAIEGTMLGIPSIAVSLASWQSQEFDAAASFTARLVGLVAKKGLPEKCVLNVNVPSIPAGDIAGVRVTRLGKRVYRDAIVEKTDPRGKRYFWIGGKAPTFLREEKTDFEAVDQGFISITPLQLDMTDYRAMVEMASWDFL
jgi:5'-nucleotidase